MSDVCFLCKHWRDETVWPRMQMIPFLLDTTTRQPVRVCDDCRIRTNRRRLKRRTFKQFNPKLHDYDRKLRRGTICNPGIEVRVQYASGDTVTGFQKPWTDKEPLWGDHHWS